MVGMPVAAENRKFIVSNTTPTALSAHAEQKLRRLIATEIERVSLLIAATDMQINDLTRAKDPSTLAGREVDEDTNFDAQMELDGLRVRRGRDEQRLNELRAAADKLADGTYGTCVGCGTVIPDERLIAVPGTSRCVNC